MSSTLRFLVDFGPLAAFFAVYKLYGLMAATAVLIAATTLALSVGYLKERKIAILPMITGVLVLVFGGLTLWLQDEYFIKIKPTIINLLFAIVLLGGCWFKKPLLKYVLGYALDMTERGWMLLSFRWGMFFMFLAGLNEYVWRTQPTDFWVSFKVFGMLSCTIIFTLLQLPLMKREMIEPETSVAHAEDS